MLGGITAGYHSLRQTGAKGEISRFGVHLGLFWAPKPACFLSPGQKRNCGPSGTEKFSALPHVLSQTPTRSHAAGFGGMTLKTDEPTGVNSNGATANAHGVPFLLMVGLRCGPFWKGREHGGPVFGTRFDLYRAAVKRRDLPNKC